MGGGKGGGSDYTVGYQYSVGMHLALCHGPVDAFYAIWCGEDYQAWSGNETANATIYINQPNLFGGKGKEGGIRGYVDFCFGADGQAANDYLTSQLGAVPAYRGVSCLVLNQVYVGDNPYIKPWSVLGRRTTTGWYGAKATIGNDMNAIHMIRECQTNAEWGMGYTSGDIDSVSYEAAADTLFTEGLGLSLIWDQATDIEGFIQEILRHIEAALYLEPTTGQFKIKLIRDDYTPAALPVLDSTIVEEVQEYSRRTQAELVNTVILSYLENLTSFVAATGGSLVAGTPDPATSAKIWGLDYSPDGTQLAVYFNAAPYLKIFTLADWSVVAGTPTTLAPNQGGDVKYSPSGFYLAVALTGGSPSVVVLRTADWTVVAEATAVSSNGGWALDWSPDGRYLALNTFNGPLIVFDSMTLDGSDNWTKITLTAAEGGSLGGHGTEVTFSPDGNYLAACNYSGSPSTHVFRVGTWEIVATHAAGCAAAFSPDSSLLAIKPVNTSSIYILATATWQQAAFLASGQDGDAVVFSADGDYLLRSQIGAPPKLQIFAVANWSLVADTPVASVSALAMAVAGDGRIAVGGLYTPYLQLITPPTPAQTVPAPDVEQSITVHNLGLINAMGEVVSYEVNFPGISQPALANLVAARELKNHSAEISSATLLCNRKAHSLRVGDPFKFTWPEYGVTEEIMRVTEIDFGTLTAGKITIRAAQDIAGAATAVYADPVSTAWTDPVSPPAEAPYRYLAEATYYHWTREIGETATVWGEIDATEGMLLHMAAKPSGDALDYTLQTRLGSAEFADRAPAKDFTPTATLAAAINKTATTLDLENLSDLGSVVVDTYAYLGEEIVGVASVDTGASQITVLRGILDTVPQAHDLGARIWFGSKFQASDSAEYFATEIVSAKALPRTARGTLAASLAPIDSLTFNFRLVRPFPPGLFRLNTEEYPSLVQDDITVSWAHRDRLQQTAYFVEQSEANIGPEAGTTYSLSVVDAGETEIYSTSAVAGTSAVIPTASLSAGMLTLTLWAVRGGYDSWQSHKHTFEWAESRITENNQPRITENTETRTLED